MIAPVAPGTGTAHETPPRGPIGRMAVVELSADTLTPVAAALRLKDRLAFILESVEGGARYGRYSFVGVRGRTLVVDQGEADPFLQRQLQPQALEQAARVSGQSLRLRRHAAYDHSYWFVQSFVADHLAHHAAALCS